MTRFRLIDTEILHLDKFATIALQEGILSAQNLLSAIATDEDFLKKVTLAFGNGFDAKKLENLRQQWENGNFEGLPAIDIRSAADINGANGAFAKATNKIYLSQEYIVRNTANPQAIAAVVLEEIGHFVDAQINLSDAPGDEGAIFAALVQGEQLDESALQVLKAEDDIIAIALDGKIIQVEQQITEIIPTIAVLNYAGDEGNYYDPSNAGSLNSGRTPETQIAPDLNQSEVKQEESKARSRLNTTLTLGLFRQQTQDLWNLYLDSSPTYHIDRAYFYDGSEIANGFKDAGIPILLPSETQSFVLKVLNILRDEIRDQLKSTFQASYDITSLLPDYYLRPEYNYDETDQRWEDRDGKPKAGLPQDYVSLAYSNFATIPGLLAGGIGYGGNTAIPETIDPKTKVKQLARAANLIPDTRQLEGTVEVRKIKELFYRLDPKLKITVEDTIDFSPGNLGGSFAKVVTESLWKLETNGGAYDVPFTVEFTPITTSPFIPFFGLEIDSRGFLDKIKDFFSGIASDVSDKIYVANGLDNYGISDDNSSLTTQRSSLAAISLSNGLPFLGTLLATLPEAQFLEDLYAKIDDRFKSYFGGNEIVSFEELQAAFYNILKEDTNGDEDGFQSLGVLKDTNQDGNITQDDIVYTQDGSKFKLNFELGSTNTFDTALPTQFGLPGLGLSFEDTKAGVNLTYGLKFGFGIDTATDEFFFDTSSQDDLSITLTPSLPTAEATLGFLKVNAKDIGSKLDFTVNLGDGNDNQLTIDELAQNNLTFSPTGAADIKLNFLSSIDGSAALPQIGTDLNLHWDFLQNGSAPTVSFDNTKLYFGSFLTDFLKPVVEPIQAVTKPIQPVYEFLTTEIGILKDLGISNPTLLGLAGGLSNNEDVGKAIAGIQLVGELSELVNSIDVNNVAEFALDIGDINLDNFDLRDSGASIQNSQLTSFNTKSLAELASELPNTEEYQAHRDFFTRISSNQTVGGTTIGAGSIQEFLSFPILEDPKSAIGLLTGQTVDFFNLDLPKWDLKFGIEGSFPIVGPIVVTFGGEIGAQLNLGFGYDSNGIQQWAETYNFDPNKTSVIFDGFFVDDNREGGTDLPELSVTGTIKAGVGIDIIIAAARVQGGIEASINADLEDVGESGSDLGNSDGRLRGSELANIIQNNPLCLIELGGQIDAFLGYYARVGWPPFGKKWEGEFARTKLADFGIETCPDEQPILANDGSDNFSGGTLEPNIGLRSDKRLFVNTTDNNEVFLLRGSGNTSNETVTVSALGYSQDYVGVNNIVANAGEFDDLIEVENIAISVEFSGGNGNDELYGGESNDTISGDSGNDRLFAGSGNDTVSGGIGEDLVNAGEGNDSVLGGDNNDNLSGEGGADTIDGGASDDFIQGGAGNDKLYGDTNDSEAGNDIILGDDGEDELYGLTGNDILSGGAGADTLYGGAGDDELLGDGNNDFLRGEAGNDRISGGESDDTVSYENSLGAVVVNIDEGQRYASAGGEVNLEPAFAINAAEAEDGFGTKDFFKFTTTRNTYDEETQTVNQENIEISGSLENLIGSQYDDVLIGNRQNNQTQGLSGDDLLIGNAGNDTLDGGNGIDTASYRRDPGSVNVNLTTNQATDGFGGNDAVYNIENVVGSAFDDNITGNTNANSITAGDGNDFAAAGEGNDKLYGENGNDTLSGQAGNDDLYGSLGNDSLNGGNGNDLLEGGDSDDLLVGGLDNDVLDGGGGNDQLTGEAGNDFLNGKDGNDQLYGGADADTLDGDAGDDLLKGEAGNDLIDGSNNIDTVSYDNSPSGVIVNVDETIGYQNSGSYLHETIVSASPIPTDIEPGFAINAGTALDGFGTTDNLRNLENIIGSLFNDVLVGNSQNNRIHGLAGDDLVIGNAGDDYFDGGDGIDTVSYRRDPSSVNVNLEQNQAQDGFGDNDEIYNVENLVGSVYDDEIIGDTKTNIIIAGDGNDLVEARYGNDIIFGEQGKDTLFGENGDDFLVGGTDADRLNGGEGNDTASYFTSAIAVSVSLTTGTGWAGDAKGDRLEAIENLEGSEFEDLLIGDAGNNIISGLGGNDLIYGEAGDDWLDGGTGSDRLYGGDGNDKLYGQADEDLLKGEAGNDLLFGNDGNDQLYGQDGNDTLNGDAGNDYLEGGSGDDLLNGSDGNDQIYGQDDKDILNGGTGDDLLDGGLGNDLLNGGDEDDQLYGQVGEDILNGGLGNDLLDGGDSNDLLNGDEGSDRLYGQVGEDTLNGGLGNDLLNGGDGNDLLNGDEGNDQIYGQAGDDYLDGGAGNDALYGGTGIDTLFGQAGNDYLDGGTGDDLLNGGEGSDRLYGQQGDDLLNGNTGDDYLDGGLDNDQLNGNEGNDRLYGQQGYDILDGGAGADFLDGGSDDDYLYGRDGSDRLYGQAGQDYLDGGNDDDRLEGGTGDDQLFGQQGRDYLDGGIGDDFLYGGDGADKLLGQTGNDYLDGGSGADQLDSGDGNDQLYGRDGDDTLDGSVGNDYLEGGNGNDQLIGGIGNDYLYGQDGSDTLNGGADNDNLYGGVGDDNLLGGDGNDLLSGQQGNDVLDAGVGDDYLEAGLGNDQLIAGLGNDQLYGGDGNDILDGGADNDYLEGGLGNDQLIGGDGDDQLSGQEGKDILAGGSGNDNLQGGDDADILQGQDGDDYLFGDNGDDTLDGGAGNNSLEGGAGNDYLTGGDGDNILNGGTGEDTLYGGSGRDMFVLASESGSDTIFNFTVGSDYLGLLNGLTFEQLTITQGIGTDTSNTLVNKQDGELLVTLVGVQANTLGLWDFTNLG